MIDRLVFYSISASGASDIFAVHFCLFLDFEIKIFSFRSIDICDSLFVIYPSFTFTYCVEEKLRKSNSVKLFFFLT